MRDRGSGRRIPVLRPWIAVTGSFVLSRVVFFLAGVRFDATPFDRFWQFVDPPLLRDRLFESLLYLHAQPPLFNLYLGLVAKLFPGAETAAFWLTYAVLGWALSMTIYALLDALGAGPWMAAALAIAFSWSPPSVLNENWLFYDLPVALMLALSALLLHRFVTRGRFRTVLGFFALLAAAALTRSLFHVAWLVAVALALFWAVPGRRRQVLLAAGLPLLLVLGWNAKNLVLFGTFSSSTWLGMNVARASTFLVPSSERAEMVGRGELSKYALVPPFSPLEAYRDFAPRTAPTGVAVLDQESKSGGKPNFNNAAYVGISSRYLRDGLHVLWTHPGAYLGGLSLSYFIFSFPASDFYFVRDNRERIGLWDALFSRLACGQAAYEDRTTVAAMTADGFSNARKLLSAGWLLMAGFVVSVAGGARLARRAWRGPAPDLPTALTVAFLVFNVIYVTVVGNGLEIGENNRFRFMIDPLWLVLLGLLAARGLERRRSRQRPKALRPPREG